MTEIDKIKTRRQGIAFAMSDVLAMTGVYVLTKIFLTNIPFPVFGVYWFSAGMIWNVIFSLLVPKTYDKFQIKKSYLLFLALIGFIDMLATILWFVAIDRTENPSLVSFMTNVSPIYALILGYVFLNEKWSWSEVLGIVITFVGAFLIGYQKKISFSDFFLSGAGIIVVSSFISQSGKAILKTRISNYNPIILSINRLVFLLSFVLFSVFYFNYSLNIGLRDVMLISISAMMGPVVSAYSGYCALARLKISTYSILTTSRSFFVMIASIFVLNIIPTPYQIVGGSLTVAGVVFIYLAKAK